MQVPKLRFKEFFNDWKSYKLKDTFENISIKNHPEMTILTIIQGNGTIPRNQSNRNIIFDEEKTFTYKVVNKNDFIIHLRSFEGGFEMSNYDGIVSPAYTILRGNNKVIPLFFKYYFRTNQFINGILSKTVEGIRDGRQISYNQLKDFNIPLPSLEEQEKSNFLSLIDKRIELQQKLVSNLNLYKKGLLQKVFFNNSGWKTAKLGDFLIEYNEKTTINNQYPVLTSSRKGLFLQKDYFDKQVASDNNIGYNILPYNYITYRNASDDATFYFNINNIIECGIVSPLYPVFTTKDMNIIFLQLILNYSNKFEKYCLKQQQGGTRTSMSINKLKEFKIKYPSLEEQNRIADLFTNLDKKIDII